MTADVTALVQSIAAPSPRVTGGVLQAPLGTALPVSSYATTNVAFGSLGRTSADGLRHTEDRTNTDVQDWGGDLVATLQDRYGFMVRFLLIQVANAQVQEAVHGIANVQVTPPTSTTGTEIASTFNSNLLDTSSWVFDGFFGPMDLRLVIPIGRITQVAEVRWVHNALVAYDCTVKCFPDDAGTHAIQYLNDGITTV